MDDEGSYIKEIELLLQLIMYMMNLHYDQALKAHVEHQVFLHADFLALSFPDAPNKATEMSVD